MDVLAVISQKGGAGKTTLALHLAVAAERAGRAAAVVDLDPQASAAAWKDTRTLPAPAVRATPPARLLPMLEAAAGHGRAPGGDRYRPPFRERGAGGGRLGGLLLLQLVRWYTHVCMWTCEGGSA